MELNLLLLLLRSVSKDDRNNSASSRFVLLVLVDWVQHAITADIITPVLFPPH